MAKQARRGRMPTYEDRLILFLDFLGFREVVEETRGDQPALTRLVRAMDEIGTIGEGNGFPSQRVTQFSDSVVLSFRVNEESGVFWMLNSVALTVLQLTHSGYLLRGAVTSGELLHTKKHVVGPAMVRAYEMESKHAKYPRVIVDPAIVTLARQYRSSNHSPTEEARYVRDFLTKDDDGQLYFDLVSWDSVVRIAGGDDEDYPSYLGQIARFLERGLKHPDVRVLPKYLWLHRHYSRARQRFVSMPAHHPYRQSNWEACEYIDSLPSFDKLAQQAEIRLATPAA